ncbi:hypothetical protein CWI84_02880 [Idiomarina tyrosinivorans]|uniref:DNA phosphorothioation-associated protein 4 n=1 Tax=Idiomarina tyrosinivorans TaxID=1445662 RepID=A0A432ZT27_9GAMM|nr:hypothetical protein [Idiomarina tyrosinivorans]RUO81070.1 hypothetical protein CWI84_02880 [Idiomarina tyrosinivorans]
MINIDDNEWRNIPIRRERKFESLVEKFCTDKYNSRIFRFNKDLMLFAAMVGFSEGKSKPVSANGIQIVLGTYASDQKDGYIYLLALLDKKDITSLKNENLSEAVKSFEGYCNAGLEIIQNWIDENPGDPEGVDTIMNKVFERIQLNEIDNQKSGDYSGLDPEF